jgi:tetratricopeptide (TPR) repeat protein
VRPSRFRTAGLILLALATIAPPRLARADTAGSVAQLIRSARYWEQRGREDKAAEAWNQVLAADPQSEEALVAVTNQSLRGGQVDAARDYLNRLKEAHPTNRDIPQLERAVELGRRYENILAEARAAAQAGRPDDAVVKYRELFAGKEPPVNLALEFYQTLGGSKRGWAEARDGMQELVRRFPRDPHYRIALAKHLTYREETRADGIHQLETLSSDPVVGHEADEAWKQALSWMGNSPAAEALMATYIARHSEDSEMSGALAKRQHQRVRSARLSSAYGALDRGELDSAQAQFEAAGPADPEAVAGLGFVAMKKSDFARASELLEKAIKMQPSLAPSAGPALHSARFWSLVQQARADQAARRYDDAEKKLGLAVEESPDDRIEADRALAGLFLEKGDLPAAEERLRVILRTKADDPDATRELISILLRTERSDEALALNQHLREVAPAHALSDALIRSDVLRAHAAENRSQGRMKEAREILLDAEKEYPDNAWVEFDLANLLLETNELDGASAYADRAASLDPTNSAIRALGVRILAARGQLAEAVDAIRKLPPDTMGPELEELRRRLEFQLQVQQALAHGVGSGGLFELEMLESHLADGWDMAPLVARAWATIGDRPRGIKLMRKVIAEKRSAGYGAQLQLASLLFDAHQDEEAIRILEVLQHDTRLTRAERQGLEDLRVSAVIRYADSLKVKGQPELAMKEIRVAGEQFPENSRLLCALGRLLEATGDNAGAATAFNHVLQADPRNLDARSGAIEVARATRDTALANRLMDDALRLDPENPGTRLLAARQAMANDDDETAMTELRRAESQLPPPPPGSGTTESGLFQTAEDTAVDPAAAQRKEIHDEMDRLRARHAYEVSGTLDFRYRLGEPGLGLLTSFVIPVGVAAPIGLRGHLSLTAAPTFLDGGTPNISDAGTAERFGSLLGVPSNLKLSDEVAEGVALLLGYRETSFSAEAGSTPLGFPRPTVQGDIRWTPRWGDFGIALEAFRRPVTDSLLSFAGLVDPVTGRIWGAVLKNAGRLEASYAPADILLFAFFQYGVLQGTEVAVNTDLEGGAGGEGTFLRRGDSLVTGGLDGIYMGYGSNERFFTLGQGGYFSPQAFVHVGASVRWRGGSTFRWDLKAEPGFNWFQEASSPYYPVDPSLQTAREAMMVDFAGHPLVSTYPGRTSSSFSFDALARAWLPISKLALLSFNLQFHTAADYEEFQAGLELRFDIVPAEASKGP